mgnify:CR=1 FL=1
MTDPVRRPMRDAALHHLVREALEQARPDATIAVLRPLLAEHLDGSISWEQEFQSNLEDLLNLVRSASRPPELS